MKNILYIRILIIVSIIVLGSILILDFLGTRINTSRKEIISVSKFADVPIPVYEKNRTLLYGSLFLDKLNQQIKEMTDPKITYDDKRIDIVKYSDILL